MRGAHAQVEHLLFAFLLFFFGLHVLISMVFADMGSVLTKLLRATYGAVGWIRGFYELVDSHITAVFTESQDEDANVMTLETLRPLEPCS